VHNRAPNLPALVASLCRAMPIACAEATDRRRRAPLIFTRVSTRSANAFLGLAKTCGKLKIAFWDYLGDRLAVPGAQAIPQLPKIILARTQSP
jgi:hypothetical protein